VSWQLGLAARLTDYWDESLGSKVSCKIYFETYLLEQIGQPIVLAFSDLNRLFEHPQTGSDFLSMLRFWHEQSRQDLRWRKLRLLLVHNSELEVGIPTQSGNSTGLDVGLSLSLPSLTLEQVQILALKYGLSWAEGEAGQARLQPLYHLLGGHPYLVSLALYHLHHGLSLEQILATATQPSSIYSQFLRETLALVQPRPHLLVALQQVFSADRAVRLDTAAAYPLESMGLIQLEGLLARPACELYRCYFLQFLAEVSVQAVSVQTESS
jgi:hypothetical protein